MSMGPYAAALSSEPLRRLPLIPLVGDDGKKPAIRNWNRPAVLQKIAAEKHERFLDSNVGLLTGKPSGVTVLDIDNPAISDKVFAAAGEPVLIVESPRGGLHGYYSFSGEKSANGFVPGLDIRGDNGFIAIPNSRRHGNPEIDLYAGRPYRLVKGNWDLLPKCSPIHGGALQTLRDPFGPDAQEKNQPFRQRAGSGGVQNMLWREVMLAAKGVDQLEGIMSIVSERAKHNDLPISPDEVISLARRVHHLNVEGRNFIGGDRDPTHVLADIARRNADAVALYAVLRSAHASRIKPFAIVVKAMAEQGSIAGMGVHRLRNARNWLVEQGYLVRVHTGGSCKGDAHLFTFP